MAFPIPPGVIPADFLGLEFDSSSSAEAQKELRGDDGISKWRLNLSLIVLHDETWSNAFAGVIPLGFPSIHIAVCAAAGDLHEMRWTSESISKFSSPALWWAALSTTWKCHSLLLRFFSWDVLYNILNRRETLPLRISHETPVFAFVERICHSVLIQCSFSPVCFIPFQRVAVKEFTTKIETPSMLSSPIHSGVISDFMSPFCP